MSYFYDASKMIKQQGAQAQANPQAYSGNGDSTWDGVKNWLFGGNATEGMAGAPQNYGYASGYLKQQLEGAGNRPAPMFNSLDAARARAEQMGLAQQLQGIASGQQVGAGEMAVNRQVGQAQAAQQAGAQMARGQNAALAMRNAARNNMQLGTSGAGLAAQAQLQDATNAQGQLSALLGNVRAQDVSIGQGNQNAQLAQTGMNQNAQLGYLGQLLGWDQAALQQDALRRQLEMSDKGMFPQLLAAGGQIGTAAAAGPAGAAAAGAVTGGAGGAPRVGAPSGPVAGNGLGSGGRMPWQY